MTTLSAMLAAVALWTGTGGQSETPLAKPYHWKSVQMVGGGFVDGIVFHPTAKGVRYARTDIGGAYRWNGRAKEWTPILDWLSYEDTNLMGVESIALDPRDPRRLYLACGMYTNAGSPNAAILRSSDQGRTFQRANLPFKMGGNENGRGNGERLAVDPNDGKILYFGSRRAGLWRSTDQGATWDPVASFPFAPGSEALTSLQGGVGVNVVQFDPTGGSRGAGSKFIYASVSVSGQPNLFRTRDGGATWQPIPGEPTQFRPTRMVLASDGSMFVTYGTSAGPSAMRDGAVWKLDTRTDVWTDITPERPNSTSHFGYAAVSVQADNPKTLIVSTFYHPNGEEIFRSLDGGASWRPVIHPSAKYDFALAPYVAKTPIHWLFDAEIDPCDPNHAMFTTGYGGYETFDLTDVDRAAPTTWHVMSKGIEETVALELVSPTSGKAHLLSAIGDYGGFVHWKLDRPSPEGNYGNPTFGNTTGVAVGDKSPDVMVRVGNAAGNHPGANIGYSLDGGRTWQPPASVPSPTARSGSIAVSNDGAIWLWSAAGSMPYITRDRGVTWTQTTGLPRNAWVIADPVDSSTFYSIDLFGGALFVSRDGGDTFGTEPLRLPDGLPTRGGNRGDNRGGQDRIYATPGRKGDLWVAAFSGLYHASDPSAAFSKLPGVEQIHAFGFGKGAPDRSDPALFLVGIVRGVRGVFRSDDFGANWTRINDDRHQWGLILQVTGDPRIYGRVYVGTHGRGVLYGDP